MSTGGEYKEGLFAIKCPDCLKDAILFPCVGTFAVNEKLGSPCTPAVACLGTWFLTPCALCQYGEKLTGESAVNGLLKGLCCGGCYAHQLVKEAEAYTGGAPPQVEMS